MKTIGEQINLFLAEANLPAARLSEASGIKNAYISRLRRGKQRDIFSTKADALRAAMVSLNPDAARKALE